MMLNQKPAGPIKGCLLPIVGLVGFIALCYFFCLVMFLVASPGANTASGGFFLFPFH